MQPTSVWVALKQSAELARLVQILADAAIDSVALKGPLLALELYGDVGARCSKDIDLVIQPQDTLKADQLVQQLGYERSNLTARQLEAHLYWSKDFVYWHPDKRICLELHWRLFQDWECFSVFDTPLQNTELLGVQIKHLSPEYNLLYLCTHGCESGWSRPQWGLDIQKLLKKYELDWVLIQREAKTWDLEGALREGTNPLPALSQKERGKYVWRFSDWWHKLLLRKKFTNRAKVIWSLFVPRLQDFETLALPDQLFFLYYAVRPGLALRRNQQRI